jgi:[ribosomal protein S18]-alanine N-acetyltransferase
MKTRALTLADLDAVTDLDELCFPPGEAFSRDMFEDCLLARSCLSFGIDGDGALIAFLVLMQQGQRAGQIITLDIHPRYRRQGLANLLMEELDRIARGRNLRRLALQVAINNEPAIALYLKWGFSIRTTLPNYYGRGKDAYLMDKIMMDLGGGNRPDYPKGNNVNSRG